MPKPEYLVLIANSMRKDIVALKSVQQRQKFIAHIETFHSDLKADPIKREQMYELGIFCFTPTKPSIYGFCN
jgi:hypothetical protein